MVLVSLGLLDAPVHSGQWLREDVNMGVHC